MGKKLSGATAATLKRRFILMLCAFMGLNCFFGSQSFAQVLPADEVKVLQTIFSKLRIKDWNVSPQSCSESRGLNKTYVEEKIVSNVTCDCSFNSSTVCRVKTIQLEGLNLTGVLPIEFADLSHLTELDLSRNYINGSIPTAFARLPLTRLSLLGNRIRGTIPEEIGEISTLEELNLEDNFLEGSLPKSLGSLSRLRRLLLSANNFTGNIPETFSNLKNLTELRIDGSRISGSIPDWIGNWTSIEKLHMQGTSLIGPIPSTISHWKNLTELRISDLNVSSMEFPNFQEMNMKILILRNCSITGRIPDFSHMENLKTLDLSFNKLNGQIPFQTPMEFDNLFLSHNALTGEIPRWIVESEKNIDVSYNNFTEPSDINCLANTVNVVSSYSTSSSKLMPWCSMKGLPCSNPDYSSLYINCGGGKIDFEGHEYEEDLQTKGPSYFFSSSQKWAYSSTGLFMAENENAKYAVTNTFLLNVSGAVYETARQSPVSLTYYGLCMKKGSYKVQLHFAEIMFSNDENFSSLGRRIFDVAIQGKVVLTDFNIVEDAKGVGKEIIKEFNDVHVNGSTLEIHLYWRGKGTTAIPERNVHGPLISAITVTPNFDPDTGGLSAGAIVGIVASSCVVLLLSLIILRKKGYLGEKHVEDIELRALDLQTGYFTLRQIKIATNNFDIASKIGEGGFGPVYKGVLADGTFIAVKQLSSKSKQGNREFVNEIGMISALQHHNLVKLYGCCIEGNQLLLIYEYLENNCLARALFGSEGRRLNLDWQTRKNICLGIARGLAYLHEESRLKIVHRDIKATNVLLDKDLNAKISDFGLAKLDEEEDTHISTRIAGTVGYMAPEYAMRGYLTDKADVYSFGVVALEIVSGKSNTNYRPKEEFVYLLDWAYVLEEKGNLLELVDPSLGLNYHKEEAMRMLNMALMCTNPSPTLRPSMSSVVSMLEGKIKVQAPVIRRGSLQDDARFKAFQRLSQDSQIHVSNTSQDSQVSKDDSMDGPWIESSSSSLPSKDETRGHSSARRLLPDLYDVNLD